MVHLDNLTMTLKCFAGGAGGGCDPNTPLILRSNEELTVLRLAAIQAAPYESLGVEFTDEST